MYVGRDFDPSDTGESERYTLDFVNDLQAGDAIVSAAWFCEVSARSENQDGNAAAHITGAATISATKVTQRVAGLVPGVTYCLTANATTTAGDILSLWAHVECREPA